MNVSARMLRSGMRAWQVARSGYPSPCRFFPTCSTYGIEALERHGAWRGSGLTIMRLLRCHPWGSFGYDPVPERAYPTTGRGAGLV